MSKNLSDYISLSNSKPPRGEVFFALGKWLKLDVPFVKWKEPLRSRWARMARVLFSGEKEEETVAARGEEADLSMGAGESVCLCAHVKKCPIKGSQTINPLCPKFAFGICVEATLAINDGRPLSFASIGYLTGISKQRVEQIYSAAQTRLIEEIKRDPVLLEYCQNQGIGFGALDNG